ncbi:Mitochondrial group I intron splicing factor ccm1 [Nowakowskiella sp. JEL0407]|nr:Mitochondrial group I intron splicing factor ccm1 [Nowakowskiella sp. JEL0407]
MFIAALRKPQALNNLIHLNLISRSYSNFKNPAFRKKNDRPHLKSILDKPLLDKSEQKDDESLGDYLYTLLREPVSPVGLTQQSATANLINEPTLRILPKLEASSTIPSTQPIPQYYPPELIKKQQFHKDMKLYSELGDVKKTLSLFEQFCVELSKTADPDIYGPDADTFGYVIYAHLKNGDIQSAFRVYATSKKLAVNQPWLYPNLKTHTMLIQKCVELGQLNRAWRLFDFYRMEVGKPDSFLFTVMIEACSVSGNTERAFDLFREMVQFRGLTATIETFNAVLMSCLKRKEYFEEALEVFRQMVEDKGVEPNLKTFDVMFKLVAKNGDVERLRVLWNSFLQYGNLERGFSRSVVERCLAISFECYARAIERSLAGSGSGSDVGLLGEGEREFNNEGELSDGSAETESEANAITFAAENSSTTEGIFPIFNSNSLSANALITECKALWDTIGNRMNASVSTASTRNDGNQTGLLLGYLRVLSTTVAKGKSDATELLNFFNANLEHIDKYRRQYAWKIVLRAITRKPANTEKYWDEYWKRYLEFDGEMENVLVEDYANMREADKFLKGDLVENAVWLAEEEKNWVDEEEQDEVESESVEVKGEESEGREEGLEGDDETEMTTEYSTNVINLSKPMPLSFEKEMIRKQQGRGKEELLKMFVWGIQGLTRIDKIDQALDLLEHSQTFREYQYLPQLHFRDIWSLLQKCYDLAESGDVSPARRLVELCPSPPPGLYESNLLKSVGAMGPGMHGGTGIETPLATAEAKLHEVEKMIRDQWGTFGGRKWWGWDAIGVGFKKRDEVIKKIVRERKIDALLQKRATQKKVMDKKKAKLQRESKAKKNE